MKRNNNNKQQQCVCEKSDKGITKKHNSVVGAVERERDTGVLELALVGECELDALLLVVVVSEAGRALGSLRAQTTADHAA